MACGAPEMQAPTMMSHDGNGHCFFVRQPSTLEETGDAILGVWSSCCGAVRYGGRNTKTLIRLAELGLGDRCDYRLEDEPKPVRRSCVSFEFGDPVAPKSPSATAEEIMEYFARALRERGSEGGRVLEFRCSAIASSFRYEWGDNLHSSRYAVTLSLECRNERDWLLRILRNEVASTAFAISIHKATQHDARFRQVQWFSEEGWQKGREGRPRPY
jgi:hypothetical protein